MYIFEFPYICVSVYDGSSQVCQSPLGLQPSIVVPNSACRFPMKHVGLQWVSDNNIFVDSKFVKNYLIFLNNKCYIFYL